MTFSLYIVAFLLLCIASHQVVKITGLVHSIKSLDNRDNNLNNTKNNIK